MYGTDKIRDELYFWIGVIDKVKQGKFPISKGNLGVITELRGKLDEIELKIHYDIDEYKDCEKKLGIMFYNFRKRRINMKISELEDYLSEIKRQKERL